jgi:glutamate/tyrosine decarboxylase-like PLP-dependent enzyme
LSITTFRCVPRDLRPKLGEEAVERYLDVLNRHVLDRQQHGGEVFVSNAVVGNRYVLRACIVNFHTTDADVESTVEIAARLGREVKADLSTAMTGAAEFSTGMAVRQTPQRLTLSGVSRGSVISLDD